MSTQAVRLNWSGRHGPIWAGVNVALGLTACLVVVEMIPIRPVVDAVRILAGVSALALLVLGKPLSRRARVGLAALAASVWALAAYVGSRNPAPHINPWNPITLGSIIFVAVCVAALLHAHRNRRDAQLAEANHLGLLAGMRALAQKEAEEWRARIARVCRVQGRVVSIKKWQTGTGFALTFLPDEGGTTTQEIAMQSSRLAADARLPIGCGVEVISGAHRGEVVLQVSTVNAMVDEKPYPTETPKRSINQSLPLGIRRDGTESTVTLRFASLALAGQKGSGKTNRLHVLTAQLATCTDVLTWHIDLTGGLSLPWVQPWVEKRAAAPGVDWVATTVDEARLMVGAALAIVRGRKPAYRDVMRRANDDKLPVSRDIPQVVVIIDEFASLPRDLQNLVIKLSDEGRGPGVQTVACALRGTADYLPKELLVQAANRISMRGSSESEHAFVHGWSARMDPDEVPYEGCGFVTSAEDYLAGPRPDRAYRITPSMVDDVVVKTAARRPKLDGISVKLADDTDMGAYTDRWARFHAEADAIAANGRAKLDAAIAEHVAQRVPATPAVVLDPSIAERYGDPSKWPTPRGVQYQRSPAQQLLVDALKAAAPNGLQPGAIHARLAEAGHATTRQTVMTWLALEMSRGTLRQPVDRGPYYISDEVAS